MRNPKGKKNMKKNIKIRYGEAEYGWAERLSSKLVRILNQPVLVPDEIWEGDIVKIGDDPEGRDAYPVITKVVETRYPVKTHLDYRDDADLDRLQLVLAPLGAAAIVVREPSDERAGELIVGHEDDVDPVLLAESIG